MVVSENLNIDIQNSVTQAQHHLSIDERTTET